MRSRWLIMIWPAIHFYSKLTISLLTILSKTGPRPFAQHKSHQCLSGKVEMGQGSQPLWKSRKPWRWVSNFPVRENSGNLGKRPKIREFVTVTQKAKVFASLVYVLLMPCVQVVFIDWLVLVAFVNITHLNDEVFSLNFGTFSGKTQWISFS